MRVKNKKKECILSNEPIFKQCEICEETDKLQQKFATAVTFLKNVPEMSDSKFGSNINAPNRNFVIFPQVLQASDAYSVDCGPTEALYAFVNDPRSLSIAWDSNEHQPYII